MDVDSGHISSVSRGPQESANATRKDLVYSSSDTGVTFVQGSSRDSLKGSRSKPVRPSLARKSVSTVPATGPSSTPATFTVLPSSATSIPTPTAEGPILSPASIAPAAEAVPAVNLSAPQTKKLADLVWEPCLPGTLVHAFVQGLSVSTRSAYTIFNAFANCGIESPPDFEALMGIVRDNTDEARQLLMKRGLTYVDWLVVRHGLLNRGSRQTCPGPDNDFAVFLTTCSPPLTHHTALLHDMCLHTLADIRTLSSLPAEWPHTQTHLLYRGFTLLEWFGFKHGLQTLAQPEGVSTPPMPPTGGLTAIAKMEAFKRIGLRSEDDIKALYTLRSEYVDEVLEMLVKQGLSYSECRFVESELRSGSTK